MKESKNGQVRLNFFVKRGTYDRLQALCQKSGLVMRTICEAAIDGLLGRQERKGNALKGVRNGPRGGASHVRRTDNPDS